MELLLLKASVCLKFRVYFSFPSNVCGLFFRNYIFFSVEEVGLQLLEIGEKGNLKQKKIRVFQMGCCGNGVSLF